MVPFQVEATGLKPFTTYNYQFRICGTDITSPLGRTKTAPEGDADVSDIKLAVFSCSNYRGFFPPVEANRLARSQLTNRESKRTVTSTPTETQHAKMSMITS